MRSHRSSSMASASISCRGNELTGLGDLSLPFLRKHRMRASTVVRGEGAETEGKRCVLHPQLIYRYSESSTIRIVSGIRPCSRLRRGCGLIFLLLDAPITASPVLENELPVVLG
jgi:hypothetical protein